MTITKTIATSALLASLFFAGPVLAQTYTDTSAGASGTSLTGSGASGGPADTGAVAGATSEPGTPNTGAGGDLIPNLILLASTGAIALAGGLYLARRIIE